MSRRWGAIGFAGLLVLAACGGGDSDDSAPIIEVQGGETAAAADGGVDAASSGGAATTDEEQALAFAECMRDNGVEDFPDPMFDADGSVDFGVGPGAGGGGDFDPQGDGVQEAFAGCQSLLEGASFVPGDDDLTEIEDDLLAFAECLRDEGIDVDDPDLDSFELGGGGNPTPFGESFDPADPANADAIEACQGTFTGGPLGG